MKTTNLTTENLLQINGGGIIEGTCTPSSELTEMILKGINGKGG